MADNKKCIVCGKKYKYCGHCDNNQKMNRLKLNYCSENCRDLFKVVMGYVGKSITIKEAKDKISQINLNINMTDQIKEKVTTILSYEEPKKERQIVEINQIVVEPIEEETPKPRRRRRRKIQKEDE